MSEILFLPVKPKWADLIMSGQKTLELRKALPAAGYNKRAIIYASSPRCEIVGACTLVMGYAFGREDVTPKRLQRACVTQKEFDTYFGKTETWYALDLAHPTSFDKPIALDWIREKFGIEPPQQWRYIDGKTFDEIVEAGR